MKPQSGSQSDSESSETSPLLFGKNSFSFDNMPGMDVDEFPPQVREFLPPSFDPMTTDKVLSDYLIEVEDDGSQEVSSGSRNGQETKNYGTVGDNEDIVRPLQAFAFLSYLAATIRNIVKHFVTTFLGSNTDPEEVQESITTLKKRKLDSLKDAGGKVGLCPPVHLIVYASRARGRGRPRARGRGRGRERGRGRGRGRGRSSSDSDEDNAEQNRQNNPAPNAKQMQDLKNEEDKKLLQAFLGYCYAKNLEPYPHSFRHDVFHDFTKNCLPRNSDPQKVGDHITSLVQGYEEATSRRAYSHGEVEVKNLCKWILKREPQDVPGSSKDGEEKGQSSNPVSDMGNVHKNPSGDESPEEEHFKFKELKLLYEG